MSRAPRQARGGAVTSRRRYLQTSQQGRRDDREARPSRVYQSGGRDERIGRRRRCAAAKRRRASPISARRSAAIFLRDAETDAQRLIKEPYRKPNIPAPEITSQIDYEKWGQITYNTDHALFADTKDRFPVEFFHLGMFFKKAVRMHVVENGEAREILYDTSYFNMPADSIARQLPPGAGFAGFRIQEAKDGALDWKKNDWVAFPRRVIFPRDRRIAPVWHVGARRRARHLAGGIERRIPRFHRDLHRAGDRRRRRRCMRCSKGRRSSAPIAS